MAQFAERENELFGKRGLVPSYFELKFGKPPEAELNYLEIKRSRGSVLIEGQIDRIDLTKDGSKALVIDYKRSARDLSIHKRIQMGLEFQLPIYMLAVKQRLIHQLPTMKVIASLGYDEVRFTAPLRPDDTVVLRLEWVNRRISESKPDRGIVTVRFSLINQHGEAVMSHLDTILVRRRELKV